MTTTRHQPERGDLLKAAAPETVATLAGLDALSDIPTPAPSSARVSSPAWNCLEHVPAASIASWIAECLRFGGRRPRKEAARAAYDTLWAGHVLGARGDEPWRAPEVEIALGPSRRQPRRVATTHGGPVAR
jgi:hypothetical protein